MVKHIVSIQAGEIDAQTIFSIENIDHWYIQVNKVCGEHYDSKIAE